MWQLASHVGSDWKEPHSECWLLRNLTVSAGKSRFRRRGLRLLGNLQVHTFTRLFAKDPLLQHIQPLPCLHSVPGHRSQPGF